MFPTICCHVVCKISSTPEACGAAVAVGLGQCPVRAQGSKVRVADDTTGINHRWMGNYQFINLILARRNRGNISGGGNLKFVGLSWMNFRTDASMMPITPENSRFPRMTTRRDFFRLAAETALWPCSPADPSLPNRIAGLMRQRAWDSAGKAAARSAAAIRRSALRHVPALQHGDVPGPRMG